MATKPENTDLAIYLHFWRGDESGRSWSAPLDRDTGLRLVRWEQRGSTRRPCPITFESYHSKLEGVSDHREALEAHGDAVLFETTPENQEKHWVDGVSR